MLVGHVQSLALRMIDPVVAFDLEATEILQC
jgi:hypothetical protein